jgi:hypothetical protein
MKRISYSLLKNSSKILVVNVVTYVVVYILRQVNNEMKGIYNSSSMVTTGFPVPLVMPSDALRK